MRIEEIKEKYKDEWVLIEILGEDELGLPRGVKSSLIAKQETIFIKSQERLRRNIPTNSIPERYQRKAMQWHLD